MLGRKDHEPGDDEEGGDRRDGQRRPGERTGIETVTHRAEV